MPRRLARLLVGAVLVLLLAGCHVDATVELAIGPDGTGSLTVTAVADADVVRQAPGLAADLRFDDATAAGWNVDGPTATPDGGLRVVLTHRVTSAPEATNLLASLGPPFVGMKVERVVSDDGRTATTTLSGQLALTGGFAAFADSDLLAAVGSTPYAQQLAASGATPETALSVVLRARLPGTVRDTNGRDDHGTRTWAAPMDGKAAVVQLRTHQSPGDGGIASILATGLLVLLVVWLVAATAFIVSVLRGEGPAGQASPSRPVPSAVSPNMAVGQHHREAAAREAAIDRCARSLRARSRQRPSADAGTLRTGQRPPP